MIQADAFFAQIVPEKTLVEVVMEKYFEGDCYEKFIYRGMVEDLDLKLISSCDVLKVRPIRNYKNEAVLKVTVK